ncbi:MAG: hypothetical protein H6555_09805 [Lewinellaceae bacterium]|nr:hypothetical protein [Lewinellaceae bacterium]
MALADLRNYAPGKGAGTMQASHPLVYGVYWVYAARDAHSVYKVYLVEIKANTPMRQQPTR